MSNIKKINKIKDPFSKRLFREFYWPARYRHVPFRNIVSLVGIDKYIFMQGTICTADDAHCIRIMINVDFRKIYCKDRSEKSNACLKTRIIESHKIRFKFELNYRFT
jgi:hypothetical protein